MRSQRRRTGARERVLETASRLFYERGFHAVGIDEIVATSGVAKMTLYRHFPSKDALIVAYLAQSDDSFCAWFERALDSADRPLDKLLAVFRALERLAQSPACIGCTFQVSAAEFPDPLHPAHAVAVRHKRDVRSTFARLARDARVRDAAGLADELLMLMDGAWVAARMFRRRSPAAHLVSAAEALIDAHRPRRPNESRSA
jgi:AcrR family transcriptional regulator